MPHRFIFCCVHYTGFGKMPTGDALEEIPRVGGTTATAAGDATSKPNSLIGGTKATSKVPAGVSVAAKLANLLPSANAELAPCSDGVYVGDGLPPVPAKLAAKIRKGEFVEMGELLPEFWSSHREEDTEGKHEAKVRRSRKVTDIFTWLQCFGSYVSVRAQYTPSLIPELMAYMAAIVRVSQDYAGLAWVRYDAAYRRQAALTGNTHWSTINSTLYTICFTGRATATPRCELCFATTHSTSECAQQGDPDPGIQDRLKAIEMAVLAMTSKSPAIPGATPKPPNIASGKISSEPCRKWNSNSCTYPRCRYNHVCSSCGGSHPVIRCSTRQHSSGQGMYPETAASSRHFSTGAKPY